MGRVKLKFPDENPLFTTSISVRIGDINYGNHVGNDAILSIMHEARMRFFAFHGYTELDIAGSSIIMADVMIAYKGEAFYGDELSVRIYAEGLSSFSFDLLYHVSALRNGTEADIAHGKTGMVCYDYKAKKVAAMNDVLRRMLTNE